MITGFFKYLREFSRRYGKDERGIAAIEWGLTILLFATLFMNIMEFGILNFGNAVINNMVAQAARTSMIGCPNGEMEPTDDPKTNICKDADGFSYSKIVDSIATRSLGLVDANDSSKFKLYVSKLDDIPAGQTHPTAGQYKLGQGNDVVVFYASYDWPVMNPASFVHKFFHKLVHYEVSTVVRNEPFGNLIRFKSQDEGK